ncbi:MAG: hypothetical protein ACP5JS_03750 [Fervidobacterium sp.]
MDFPFCYILFNETFKFDLCERGRWKNNRVYLFSRKRSTSDTATFFALGFFYVLSLIGRVYEKYGYLKKFTPFGVCDPSDLLKHNEFNSTAFLFIIILYFATSVFSIYYYDRKDIYT